jgi:hypothetical protein
VSDAQCAATIHGLYDIFVFALTGAEADCTAITRETLEDIQASVMKGLWPLAGPPTMTPRWRRFPPTYKAVAKALHSANSCPAHVCSRQWA